MLRCNGNVRTIEIRHSTVMGRMAWFHGVFLFAINRILPSGIYVSSYVVFSLIFRTVHSNKIFRHHLIKHDTLRRIFIALNHIQLCSPILCHLLRCGESPSTDVRIHIILSPSRQALAWLVRSGGTSSSVTTSSNTRMIARSGRSADDENGRGRRCRRSSYTCIFGESGRVLLGIGLWL